MTPHVQRWFDGADWTEHTRPLPERLLPTPRHDGSHAAQPSAARPAVAAASATTAWLPAGVGADDAAPASGATAAYGTAPVYGAAAAYGTAPVHGAAAAYGTAPAYGTAGVYGTAPVYGAAAAYGTSGSGAGPAAPAMAWAPAPTFAHWGWRVLATLLDQLFTATPYVVAVTYMSITSQPALDALGRPTTVPTAAGLQAVGIGGLVTLVLWLVNRVGLQGRTGQSWGKRIVGLRVVREDTESPLGMWWALVRDVAQLVNGMVFYLGYLWPLWDARRQTFSDKLTHAVVVRD